MSTVTIARVATVRELLAPKLRMSRRRFQGEGSQLRTVVLGLVGVIFWAVLFAIIYRMLLYFKTAAGIGDVLALKLLGLILLAFMSVLLLSNIITSLTSFFLARDLELSAAAPIDGVRMYFARLLETMAHSSWMVVLVLVPVFSAYAVAYGAGVAYWAVTVPTLLSYLVLPAVIGAALTLVSTWLVQLRPLK